MIGSFYNIYNVLFSASLIISLVTIQVELASQLAIKSFKTDPHVALVISEDVNAFIPSELIMGGMV